jgi:hypothetical protein
MAQTPSTNHTPADVPAASGTPAAGTFKSNEDPKHEAAETAEQEAAEGAGKGFRHGGPGGSFKPNEDPKHEAGESAEREAQEDAGAAAPTPTSNGN